MRAIDAKAIEHYPAALAALKAMTAKLEAQFEGCVRLQATDYSFDYQKPAYDRLATLVGLGLMLETFDADHPDNHQGLSNYVMEREGLLMWPEMRALLVEIINDVETEGCDGCGTISFETINKLRAIVGFQPIGD